MNGTLALWCQRLKLEGGSEKLPAVQLHVNLWRDLDKHFNFLDVGFVLEEVESLERLCLYLPAPIEAEAIFDLSGALSDPDTLNAVFNDVSLISTDADDHFVVRTGQVGEGKEKLRTIHKLDPRKDIAVEKVNVHGQRRGTTISLNTALCRRIRSLSPETNDHYVRLRIYLQGEARTLFTTEDTPKGLGLSLTQDVLETTEFRLNERRSYPADILRRADQGKLNLRSVHYFLIRRKDYQLGSQHQNFRKVRYLEHHIWNSYIQVGFPQGSGARKSALSSEGMIIYQWREKVEEGKSLNDFIAYASFRTVRSKIPAYIFAAFAIGGIGSAVHNVVVACLQLMFHRFGWAIDDQGRLSLIAGVILCGLLCVPTLLESFQRWGRRR
ncbi:hypothetical protein [Novosphingobium rosa]|uniref:hypothetical protein n=1 Tax=Novosphingobium rosa TaxID=76978 RepID=UPI000AAA75E0|nr:hypothetical protein [Novosphingobium rosa]